MSDKVGEVFSILIGVNQYRKDVEEIKRLHKDKEDALNGLRPRLMEHFDKNGCFPTGPTSALGEQLEWYNTKIVELNQITYKKYSCCGPTNERVIKNFCGVLIGIGLCAEWAQSYFKFYDLCNPPEWLSFWHKALPVIMVVLGSSVYAINLKINAKKSAGKLNKEMLMQIEAIKTYTSINSSQGSQVDAIERLTRVVDQYSTRTLGVKSSKKGASDTDYDDMTHALLSQLVEKNVDNVNPHTLGRLEECGIVHESQLPSSFDCSKKKRTTPGANRRAVTLCELENGLQSRKSTAQTSKDLNPGQIELVVQGDDHSEQKV